MNYDEIKVEEPSDVIHAYALYDPGRGADPDHGQNTYLKPGTEDSLTRKSNRKRTPSFKLINPDLILGSHTPVNSQTTFERYYYEGEPRNSQSVLIMRWTKECTHKLLQARFEMQNDFAKGVIEKQVLWDDVAKLLKRECDLNVTGELCHLKFRNILQTYRKLRARRNEGKPYDMNWEYWKFMDVAVTNFGLDDDEEVQSENDQDCCLMPPPPVPFQSMCKQPPKRRRTTDDHHKRQRTVERKINKLKTDIIDLDPIPLPAEATNPIFPKTEPTSDDATSSDHKPPISTPMQQPVRNIPEWLDAADFQHCLCAGRTIGLQIAYIPCRRDRDLLILKIQQLIFDTKYPDGIDGV